ncbi:uncharacterized protein BX664DRAFT_277039 [Halteromyces radiatus]|uniref:uncharacterized protein n=1 Tax=Halteromyces radiatus TaxID=101107 RepID=UPI0022208C3B|nr:uncharacterized protein BX664DRAFT_277039 [Halteromyces radiatus]KAI8092649.1 hypothetical protein BX664DRAFT_277039 [Halteromyces radiatus]
MQPRYFDKLWILPLCLGQLVSLCITGTSSASSALWQHYQVNIPFTQNAFMYGLLAIIYGSYQYYCGQRIINNNKYHHNSNVTSTATSMQHDSTSRTQPRHSLFAVLGFSIVDVQANVLAVIAFKNTSVLSALIISSWTLPCIMLLSAHFLKTRYQPIHFFGVSLCLLGLSLLIWGDTMTTRDDSPIADHSWIGDLICLISATLYAISNVTEEYLVHYFSTSGFLSRIGLVGMIQSGMLAYYFEYDTLVTISWSWHIVTLVSIYVICLFSMYSLIPMIYRLYGATFVSMSLMTSNFYSLLIGLLFLNAKMPPLYPLAYLLVIAGATLYNLTQPPVYHQRIQDLYDQESQPFLHQPLNASIHRHSPPGVA